MKNRKKAMKESFDNMTTEKCIGLIQKMFPLPDEEEEEVIWDDFDLGPLDSYQNILLAQDKVLMAVSKGEISMEHSDYIFSKIDDAFEAIGGKELERKINEVKELIKNDENFCLEFLKLAIAEGKTEEDIRRLFSV
jgi:hypothetical protein